MLSGKLFMNKFKIIIKINNEYVDLRIKLIPFAVLNIFLNLFTWNLIPSFPDESFLPALTYFLCKKEASIGFC